jgi:hypothetical protein
MRRYTLQGIRRLVRAIAFVLPLAAMAADGGAAWKKAGADDGLRRAFERATYSLKDSGHGTWSGTNAAQRLTLELNGRESRLHHPGGSVNFHLTGYGYGDRLRQPAPARATGDGNRIEYRRGDLTEWYVNGTQGLEQGFTLGRRPGTARDDEPLVIALGVSGGMQPTQKTSDGAVLFESKHGVGLRYAGLRAIDARGRTLPSRLQVRGSEIRLIVEDRAAQYPLVVDPTWTQQQELTAAGGVWERDFGSSVSVSGDTAVIGAYEGGSVDQGAAYIFVRSGGVWSQQQELTASDGVQDDAFGYSVSVSGDTAVIGAFQAGSAVQGAAYVFVRSGGVWSQQQKLTASDGGVNDHFGYTVSVSGDTALVGARLKTVNSNTDQGAAYVFVRSNGVWSQQQELTAADGAAYGCFGTSVSLSGNTALIGSSCGKEAAYIFTQSGGVWSQQQELTAPGSGGFGVAVSLSGSAALIGGPDNVINGNEGPGAAYLFVQSGGVWTEQQVLTASDGKGVDFFGGSVSLSGNTAVVGSCCHSPGGGCICVLAEWGSVEPAAGADLPG